MKDMNKKFKVWRNEKEELHREDGPAVVYPRGTKEWWLNGIKYSKEEYKIKMRTTKLKIIL